MTARKPPKKASPKARKLADHIAKSLARNNPGSFAAKMAADLQGNLDQHLADSQDVSEENPHE